jgi:3-phenylpropionate/cinnamic acid dioxygenase small subunit
MISDHDSIRDLLARHAQLTDDGRPDERVMLYTEDGAFQIGEQRSAGHQELRATFASSASGSKHITSNTIIELDGDLARVQTDFVVFKASSEGIATLATGRYHDQMVKQEGRWRFAERILVMQQA